MHRPLAHIAASGALALLAGCAPPVIGPDGAGDPAARPPAPRDPPSARSAESFRLEQYYGRIEAGFLAQGLLRTDGGGPDTPFTDAMLAENFIRIALFDEFVRIGDRLVARQTESRLRRWERPVRIEVHFGETVGPEAIARDSEAISAFAARLARVSGHPVRTVRSGGNYHVFILHEDERRGIGPRLRGIVPQLSDIAVGQIEGLDRSSYCAVLAVDPANNGVYTRAIAVIRAENPDLFRLSCIHEELAQGLGLANDSPAARPSIFNDDEEFALLTTHDELLLRILYDPRLSPGMTAAEARPIVREIATELMGGPPATATGGTI